MTLKRRVTTSKQRRFNVMCRLG